MINVILVFVGGVIGAIFRYLIVEIICNNSVFDLNFSVFIVNMIACLFAGITCAYSKQLKTAIYNFIVVGFLGGFSTLAALDLVLLNSAKNSDSFLFMQYSSNLVALFWFVINILIGIIICRIFFIKTKRFIGNNSK